MEKTLNEKKDLLARFLGYEYIDWNSPNHRADIHDSYYGKIGAKKHCAHIPGSIMMPNNFNPDKSFDDIWPIWVRFRDWRDGKQRIPRDIVNLHLDWVERISQYITSSDTPAEAIDLIVEGVEWLHSINKK